MPFKPFQKGPAKPDAKDKGKKPPAKPKAKGKGKAAPEVEKAATADRDLMQKMLGGY